MQDATEITIGPFIVFRSSSGAWLIHHTPSRTNIRACRSAPEAGEMAGFLAALPGVPWERFTRPSQAPAWWAANDDLFIKMECGLDRIAAAYDEVTA
jgi:hypothetical protein